MFIYNLYSLCTCESWTLETCWRKSSAWLLLSPPQKKKHKILALVYYFMFFVTGSKDIYESLKHSDMVVSMFLKLLYYLIVKPRVWIHTVMSLIGPRPIQSKSHPFLFCLLLLLENHFIFYVQYFKSFLLVFILWSTYFKSGSPMNLFLAMLWCFTSYLVLV